MVTLKLGEQCKADLRFLWPPSLGIICAKRPAKKWQWESYILHLMVNFSKCWWRRSKAEVTLPILRGCLFTGSARLECGLDYDEAIFGKCWWLLSWCKLGCPDRCQLESENWRSSERMERELFQFYHRWSQSYQPRSLITRGYCCNADLSLCYC